MPITLIGSNLNTYGGAGQFEADPSTWGFSAGASHTLSRSATEQTAGLYSAKLAFTLDFAPWPNNYFLVCPARFYAEVGKTYIARVKVFTPAANKIGNSDLVIVLAALTGLTTIFAATETDPDEIEDNWMQLTYHFSVASTGFKTLNINLSAGGLGGPGVVNIGGVLHVDEFEVFEYIETDEEDPDPDPDPVGNPYGVEKVFHSRNHIVIEKTAAGAWELLSNFRLYCDIRVEENPYDDVYTSVMKVELPPDSDSKVYFYLREAFRGFLTFTPPEFNADDFLRLTDRLKRFKCFFGQLVDDETEPDEEDLTEGDTNLVVFGGISKVKYPGFDFFETYLPTNKKFMTWAPVVKEVDRIQEDYLTFFIYNDLINVLQLQAKIYYSDGTDTTTVLKTYTGTYYTELFQLPAGPQNTGVLLVDPEKVVTKYELSLLDQDDELISEVRTYHIAQVRHPLTRFFMFLNSLGAFEVVKFTGTSISKTAFNREVVQKVLPHDYAALDGEFDVNNATMETNTSYSSGYFKSPYSPREWHAYMKDFLLSPRIYNTTTGDRIPVIILSSEHNEEDQNYERYIRFEAKPAYNDESFTPDDV
jgi:hypothetical protein